MASRSKNLAELKRLMAPLKGPLAVKAVRAGMAVLESGMRSRCPTAAIRRTIARTRIGKSDRAVGGAVVVDSPRAKAVEFGSNLVKARPFVMPTRHLDGPRAEKAMEDVLKGGL
jgi:hypothetical protein